MKSTLNKITDRYFQQAVGAGYDEIDDKVRHSLISDSHEIKRKTLAKWIRVYKVHRVKWEPKNSDKWPLSNICNADNMPTFAEAVAETAICHFRKKNQKPNIELEFGKLRNEIGQLYCRRSGKQRQFTSLTSKVLWCFYPEITPIYDQFAFRAIVFLYKLYKIESYQIPFSGENGNKNSDENDKKELPKSSVDIALYTNYINAYNILFNLCHDDIIARLDVANLTDQRLPIRVFDKILVLMGNENLDFSM